MGYRKYREAVRDYYLPDAETDRDDDTEVGDGEIVTARELSRLSGCSVATVMRFARDGIIPPTVGTNDNSNPLFDLADERLLQWLNALRGAAYHIAN